MSGLENNYQLDPKVLSRIQFRVYTLERNNEKNKKYSDSAMKDKIMAIIKEEANKCY